MIANIKYFQGEEEKEINIKDVLKIEADKIEDIEGLTIVSLSKMSFFIPLSQIICITIF